jgi:hypothetical protein
MKVALLRKGQVVADTAAVDGCLLERRPFKIKFSDVAFTAASLFVNGVAVAGQFGWARDHIVRNSAGWGTLSDLAYAGTVESVAIAFAAYAHEAQTQNDSAFRLKLASYATGAIVGALNYWHYAPAFTQPNAKAVTLGLLSALSPWLWGLRSRRKSRDILLKRGLIEERSVKLGAAMWVFHTYLSAKVVFKATFFGERDPSKAKALIKQPSWTVPAGGAVPVPAPGNEVAPVPVRKSIAPPVPARPRAVPVPEEAAINTGTGELGSGTGLSSVPVLESVPVLAGGVVQPVPVQENGGGADTGSPGTGTGYQPDEGTGRGSGGTRTRGMTDEQLGAVVRPILEGYRKTHGVLPSANKLYPLMRSSKSTALRALQLYRDEQEEVTT